MKLSDAEKKELEELYDFFLHDEKILRMKDIPMHRGSNVYVHSFKVAKLAVKRGLRHKNVNLKAILIAAVLHDYYLYDWRKDRSLLKKHGSHHPYVAAKNAYKDFNVDEFVQKIIKAHMWPINFQEFPNSTEARIVNLADDSIALRESLTFSSFKQKRREKEEKFISTLF